MTWGPGDGAGAGVTYQAIDVAGDDGDTRTLFTFPRLGACIVSMCLFGDLGELEASWAWPSVDPLPGFPGIPQLDHAGTTGYPVIALPGAMATITVNGGAWALTGYVSVVPLEVLP